MIDLDGRPTARRSGSRTPCRDSAQGRGRSAAAPGDSAASGGDGEERGRCQPGGGGGSRRTRQPCSLSFSCPSYPFFCFLVRNYYYFFFLLATAVRSGKSVDNVCVDLLLDWMCGRTVQVNDLALVGSDSCTFVECFHFHD